MQIQARQKRYNYSRFDVPNYNKEAQEKPSSYSADVLTAKGGGALSSYTNAFVIQVGAFSEMANASRRANALKGSGLDNVFCIDQKMQVEKTSIK